MFGKIKRPRAGYLGACTQRVGGGRGLAARDAVCVVLILTVKDPIVQYFFNLF
jgi:hypothetical protein